MLENALQSFLIEVLQTLITVLANVLVVLIGASLSAAVFRAGIALRTKWAELRTRIPEHQLALIESFVRVAVKAASQEADALRIALEERREHAFGILQGFLNAYGIKLDTELAYAMIEAAVRDGWDKAQEYPVLEAQALDPNIFATLQPTCSHPDCPHCNPSQVKQ